MLKASVPRAVEEREVPKAAATRAVEERVVPRAAVTREAAERAVTREAAERVVTREAAERALEERTYFFTCGQYLFSLSNIKRCRSFLFADHTLQIRHRTSRQRLLYASTPCSVPFGSTC